jgi:imidazolonepropionase-like amidohydrolase
VLVDGVPQMLSAAREQLRLGASQIKLAIGGGVSSPTDPIDVTEFTKEEIVAAVAAAENWGTYLTVHGYTVRAVNQAIDAGVKVIDHGQLLDKATLDRMDA